MGYIWLTIWVNCQEILPERENYCNFHKMTFEPNGKNNFVPNCNACPQFKPKKEPKIKPQDKRSQKS